MPVGLSCYGAAHGFRHSNTMGGETERGGEDDGQIQGFRVLRDQY